MMNAPPTCFSCGKQMSVRCPSCEAVGFELKPMIDRLRQIEKDLGDIADRLAQPHARDLRRGAEFVMNVRRFFGDV